VAVRQNIASILNQRLASSLRVELDEVTHTTETGQANLTALAYDVQAALDRLEQTPGEQLTEPRVSEDGGLRVLWHVRRRQRGEEGEPVVVA
jgi:hypothetical protein